MVIQNIYDFFKTDNFFSKFFRVESNIYDFFQIFNFRYVHLNPPLYKPLAVWNSRWWGNIYVLIILGV